MEVSKTLLEDLLVRSFTQPLLIYDGECPFCSEYTAKLKLEQAVGPLCLINARESPHLLKLLKSDRNLDIDRGMILMFKGECAHGSDAINRVAKLGAPIDAFNRLNAAVFSREYLSRGLYPIMSLGRLLTLWLLGRRKIS